jgi:hypothetical protein
MPGPAASLTALPLSFALSLASGDALTATANNGLVLAGGASFTATAPFASVSGANSLALVAAAVQGTQEELTYGVDGRAGRDEAHNLEWLLFGEGG